MNRKIVNIFSVVMMGLLLITSINVYSQSDGFFDNWNDHKQRDGSGMSAPSTPHHDTDDDESLPLGSGLLILGGLGLGYAVVKKRKSSNTNKGMMIVLLALSFPAMSQEVDVVWKEDYTGTDGFTMTGFVKVVVDGIPQTNAQYEVGAFYGDKCRGKALCNTEALYVAPMSIHGNSGDELTFKVLDHNNKWVIFADCAETLTYVPNGTIGTFNPTFQPLELHLTSINYIFHGGEVNDTKSYTLSNEKPVVKLPLRNCKVIFDGHANYSGDGSTELKDIVVNAGESVKIGAGTGLKANQTVTNDAGIDGIVVQAQAPQGTKGNYWEEKFSSVGSLVSLSANVEGTFETYFDNSASLPKVPDWHLISSPVEEQVIYDATLAGDQPFKPEKGDDLFLWDEETETWCNIKNSDYNISNAFYTANGGTNFVPGRGYIASYKTAGVKSYKGTFNHGDVTVPLTKTDIVEGKENKYAGFNLVGNPYPSFLDWEDTTGWNRSKLYGYGTKEANSNCVVWVYNEDAGNYATYVQGTKVATNYGTRYIAPGQGFFVKATSAGNLVMRDGARTNEHAESGFMKGQDFLVRQDGQDLQDVDFRQDGQDLQDVLKVRVESNGFGSDEVVLAISENKMNVDKLFSMSETAPELYFNENKGNYSIIICENVMAFGQCDGNADVMAYGQYGREASLALNFKAKQMGKYTIKLNPESNGFDFVELEDSFTGDKTNLLTEEYSFYATKDDRENRFKLNFGSNQNLDLNQNFVIQNGNDLIVKGKGHLQVVDVLGRTIFEKEMTGDENIISCDYINKGICIFKLEDKTEKIVIR